MKRNHFYRVFLVFLSFLWVSGAFSQSAESNKLTTEQWKEDITYFLNEMPKVHINPFHTTSKETFEKFAYDLIKRMPAMNDNEILTEITKMTAMISDGHTAMNMFGFHDRNIQSAINLHIFPLRFYLFPDGLYVIAAAPQYKLLKGSKILKINGKSIEEVLNKIKPIVPRDNEYSLKSNIPYYLVIPEFLSGLGIIKDINEMEVTAATQDGKKEAVKISSIEIRNIDHSPELSDNKGLPLYMRNDEKNYWFEYLGESKTLYINYKRVLIDSSESPENFCKRIKECVISNDIDKTVIDIRDNGGGNNGTCQPFVNLISDNPKINRLGKLFIIIGRKTFSAASYLTTKLEFNTKAIFIGEPTGASPNHYGDNRPLILPNSKLEIRLSSIYWQKQFFF